ncbi:MAG: HD domain-containing protein [Nanobdellota archaeon]
MTVPINKIEQAMMRAYECHHGQFRKVRKIPYFVHILDVMKHLMYETDDENMICAGLLHDTLEETTYSAQELKTEFGEEVYSLVNFCTEPGNTYDSTVDNQRRTWKDRKTHSINLLSSASDRELLVFLADKLSNLMSLHDDILGGEKDIWSHFNASKEEKEWYYRSIKEKMKPFSNRRIYRIFSETIEEVFR